MATLHHNPASLFAIIGGAGPLVASRLHNRVLEAFRDRFSAIEDHDFPSLLVLNRAIDGVDERGVVNASEANAFLAHHIQALRTLGASAWMMACASLHSLPMATSSDCLDWLSNTAATLAHQGHRRIGIVGSASSRRDRVFDQVCHAHALEPVLTPASMQPLIDDLICQGMTGQYEPSWRVAVSHVEDELASQCDLIWWGCTELSFIPPEWLNHLAVQSMDAMVEEILVHLENSLENSR